MSTQVETFGEHPPRDGVGTEDFPGAKPSDGDDGGLADASKGADTQKTEQREDFLYVDVDDVEDSDKKKGSDAGDSGKEGQRNEQQNPCCAPIAIAHIVSAKPRKKWCG